MTSEALLQAQIIDYCNLRGMPVFNNHADGWTGKGVPDLFICLAGKFLAVETKVGSNDLTPAQRIWRKKITRGQGLYIAPRSLKEFEDFIYSGKW